jgi:hypothetical protein
MITNLGGVDVVEVGDTIDSESLRFALDRWDAFRASDVGQAVTLSEISAESPERVLMFVDEWPFEVRCGRGDPWPQVARLNALWIELEGKIECAEYLDLRFGEDVVCR